MSAPPTRDYFLLKCPDLAAVPGTELDQALLDAATQVNPGVFGSRTNLAIVYIAGHDIVMVHPELADERIQSETVGPISTTYYIPSYGGGGASPSPYRETRHGRRYLNLLRQISGMQVL